MIKIVSNETGRELAVVDGMEAALRQIAIWEIHDALYFHFRRGRYAVVTGDGKWQTIKAEALEFAKKELKKGVEG